MPTGSTQLAAVIGSPVRHSLSPALHNAAFEHLGLDWVYVAFEVAPGSGRDALAAMRALGIRGLSVTMPHKHDIAAAVDHLSPSAARLDAVNCVERSADGTTIGHNTDGDGFVDTLRLDVGIEPAGLRCVVVGAGGAARSVIDALARAGAVDVVVVNRTRARATTAAALAGSVGRVGAVDDISAADLVVNATSVGMGTDALPFDVNALGADAIVADLVYHPMQTALLAAAHERGVRTIGGLGMLVHQAARQLRIWTGADAPIDVMRAAAEAELARRQ